MESPGAPPVGRIEQGIIMYGMYVYRDRVSAISKEELYLIFQTTRALNSLKVFNKLLKEKFEHRNDDNIKTKEFTELMLFHASMIWEIMYLVFNSLGESYRGYIKETNQNYIDELIEQIRSKRDDNIEILREIRNKHSFHIADDIRYAIPFFTDGKARWDYKIGICRSSTEEDLFYSIEDTILMGYLAKRFSKNEIEVFDLLQDSVTKYTKELYDLFNSILYDFLNDKVYVQEI
jgi:hypothetical protein